eukprot:3293058-Pleurochrysis_carterae.AAC.2
MLPGPTPTAARHIVRYLLHPWAGGRQQHLQLGPGDAAAAPCSARRRVPRWDALSLQLRQLPRSR